MKAVHQPGKKEPRVYGWNDLFPFGTYKGKTLSQIANHSLMYLEYIYNEKKLHLSPEVIAGLKQCLLEAK